jgi:pimeloyl-ACP methyl ester carboxylesterase
MTYAETASTLTLTDGRELDLRTTGPDDAPVHVHFHGTPQSGGVDRVLLGSLLERAQRVVSWSRPGYATSTPQPGRTVASVAADACEVLDQLGVDSVTASGWSGGGPHVLAFAALAPDRCRAASVLAGVAPYAESLGELDFFEGFGQDNVEEFGAAIAGEEPLREFLAPFVEAFRTITREDVVGAIGSLLPEADRRWIAGDYGLDLAAGFREAVEVSGEGWVHDDLAFVQPWGFDLGAIDVPIALWHGAEDLMVPSPHGRWLARAMPQADARLIEGEGHLSVVLGRSGEIIDALLEAAG